MCSDQMRRLRLGEQDVIKVTARVIIPLLGGLIGMIILPPLFCLGCSQLIKRYTGGDSPFGSRFVCKCIPPLFPSPETHDNSVEFVYPSTFMIATLSTSFQNCSSLLASWSQIIRDNEFLLEMRLKNIDHDTNGGTTTG